ncbi:winged helix-turn-helix domain-containing protein [Planomonospora venezuelensis]|uniref:winged helix-turn-helix domain-containing protein n=1 Tax=Planomonospora venezuelensis TaxID=1999 RepID=UPI001AD3EDB4|nr:hypothetical protein Pve01_78270 [Planomonospora venezuelensis]
MIEWRADLPRWQQVANIVRRRIESGEYPAGRMLTERALAEEFGVAYTTIRKATKWLPEQGHIYTRPYLGSFVGPEPTDDDESSPANGSGEA